MAVAMHASTNDYTTRHHTSDYSSLRPHAGSSSLFSWHEAPSLTPPASTSTHPHRSIMQGGSSSHGSHPASSASVYNSDWSNMYTSSSSSEGGYPTLLNPASTSHSSLHRDVGGHAHSASSLRNALQPSLPPLVLSVDNILSPPPREFPSHGLDGPGQHHRRPSYATTSNSMTTLSTSLAAASWDEGLISFADAGGAGFDDDSYTNASASPVTGPSTGHSAMVKSEPDETHCQFILENYADDSSASPILPPSPLGVSLSGASSSSALMGRVADESRTRRTNALPLRLPLRAVNAGPEMYAMMSVIRLDPFASVNGVPQNKNVPSLWNGEPRPLDEEPVLLEWQVDLLEPLVPQTPDSDFAQLPDIDSEDGYEAVKLSLAGPIRERMRSPFYADRRGSGGSTSTSASPRESASPLLRLMHGSKAERSCRSPLSYTSRSSIHEYVGRRDSDEMLGDFPFPGGSLTFAKSRGSADSVMGGLLDHGVGSGSGMSGGMRDTSYMSPPQLHGHQTYSSNNVRLSQSHSRQRSNSHAIEPIPTSSTSQSTRSMALYESIYPASHSHLPQSFTPSHGHSHSMMSEASNHSSGDAGHGYGYSML